ncbi:MAG: GTP 3',8-cyclase MoaA [Deltaproteobacteria bacterium]|nr:GTP 3',8-cyclase MoaA [Deltaproteobacteria bacterium]
MYDNHNRMINYLRVSVTDRCNLRCIYCMPKEGLSLLGHADILSYEEILRIVTIAVKTGIVKVRLTGGEPLVRRGLVEFVSSLNKIEGLKDITLTTNGILLENYAEPLFQAGIRRINVSLDSLNVEKYKSITRLGDLLSVIRGIKKAECVGFSPIKINVVAIKGFNDDEILDFAKLTVHKPYQVRFIEYMPIGDVASENGFEYLSNDIVKKIINNYSTLERTDGYRGKADGPAQVYRMKGAVGEIGLISSMSHQFCNSCNRLRLTADGHLRACLLSDDEVDLKSMLRSGCSNSDLESLIKKVILDKPKIAALHCYESQRKKCVRNMSVIGG